ncbi:bifunctional adenosylcobinamide kinase/adenosylcobinamide-phosphate guanylyltransferase [Shewanella sp. WXL01]|uniref:Bifunctional adenosylcobalamin biosynthesis protein n=1 Tax=Shewanella maritima TaxID=2520507 RepID=A0A411PKB2_9GAMM|nr:MULTISPECIES: bifunctional adenosylcobinamide kinase/adenosylcobinamide-phosphate guanylyltransferase [Shewanella]NKF50900.1 bifunctional adenosylcobinamide kinase/adenosylcobinamide-phosphate guanylyltransferase [Shewanella sp. WXL01]QBF83870.1 bifunctional adenosylcobinamide kinase/adenosylcobinamide-phosphate guanylyltransferase [Shewanella maritima]
MIQLILGGARSGKSHFGESAVAKFANLGQSCVYLATAQAFDDEMHQRIERHQQDRAHVTHPELKIEWQLLEEPLYLAETLKLIDKPNQTIFVDCLTLYLTQHLLKQGDSSDEAVALRDAQPNAIVRAQLDKVNLSQNWQQQKQQLLAVLPKMKSNLVIVSNEVGSGIVPMGELSREFVDEAGWLNQAIAQIADQVTLVVAGLPLSLKGDK